MPHILLCLLLAVSLGAAADIYRWVDEDGNVHYGDTPKPSVKAELIQRRRPPLQVAPAQEPADEEDAANAEADASPAPQKETPFAEGTETATAQQRCEEFRARLTRYQGAGDMFIDNPDGSRHKLADDERENLIARTQRQADEACAQI